MAREVLSNGVIVPEKYTRDWFDDFRTNLVKLNDAITAIAGKQNALTQEQLDAVNSAITSQKVTAYDDHIADTSKHLTDGTASKAIADEDGTSIKNGYVNVAGNQTVTGQKIWTQAQVFQNNIYLANTSYTVGAIPTSNITSTCFFSGASNYQIGYCRSVVYKTTGQTSAELTARNKFANGALDPNGDYTNATLTVNLDADGTRWIQFANSSIKNGLTPYATDTYNIGSATNQWLRLFAKFYYYNGIQWGLDQANTWTGYNTFTNYITSQESAPIPAGGYGKGIAFRDYQNNRFGYIQPSLTSDSEKRLLIGVDSGDIASNSNIIPNANNLYSLGSSSYQWSSVYAQTYYYNGTAWGLDKANVWGNTQTVTGNDKGWNIINPDIEKGVIPSTNKSSFVWWADKNNNFLGRICSRVHTDGTTVLWLSSLNYYKNGALDPTGSSATTSLILGVDANAYKFIQANADFRPDVNNTVNLGTSTNKWKTLNGVNPGALSLPSTENAVSLDTTNVSMNGTYTYLSVSVNGWLYIALKDTAIKTDGELTFYIGDSGISSAYAKWAVNFVCSTDGYVRCFIPVLANSRIRVRINPNGGSPTGLSMTIYPCLGNV